LKIRIFYDNIDFRIRSWRKIKKLVEKVITKEGKISGDLNFIITNDTVLKEINVKFLSHDYFTDAISFNYDYQNNLAGEIYISIDTVKRNAKNYKVSYSDELLRVIIHGVLHICDYDDKKDEERKKMRRLENLWMKVFKEM
jgi:probable rRNA maturation factor